MVVHVPPSFNSSPSNTSNSSEIWAVDFRGTAPVLSKRSMVDSVGSVGVLCETHGLAEVHSRWGALS